MTACHAFLFRDFESFRERLRGWDTDPVQLGAGPLRLRWEELRLADFGIGHLDVNRRLADVSTVAPGGLVFSVALRPYRWCGQHVPCGSLIIMAEGREHRSAFGDGFRSVEIEASEALLAATGLLPDGIDRRAFAPERCVVPLTRRETAEFEHLALQLGRLARCENPEPHIPSLRARSLRLLTQALHRSGAPGVPRVPRYALARSTLRLIEDSPGTAPAVGTLAETLGVSARALEYAFESAIGVPPARYMLSRRLGRARRDLLAGRTHSVTQAAARQGFENLSRFAHQYRRLFGELPSQTLRASAAPSTSPA